VLAASGLLAGEALAQSERSYWVHASLGLAVQRGYYGPGFPGAEAPSREQVGNAARLLAGRYGANRLYLLFHGEIGEGDEAGVGGLSCDLYILHENSRHAAHDGRAGSFYQTLREGREYGGTYDEPFREIAAIYRELRDGAQQRAGASPVADSYNPEK
jgi:hypothetical protein